jgi:tetratricopeptide (TPR) repeat protein
MASRFIGVVAVVAFVAAIATAAPAHAGNVEKARALNDKATTAFALGRYGVAADYFEQAFELKSDPALLYNAAQAHRLAGNRERALSLYVNYLRIYANGAERVRAEQHVQELRAAIEQERKERAPAAAAAPPRPAASPPAEHTEPAPTAPTPPVPLDPPAPAAPKTMPPPAAPPAATLTTSPAPVAAGPQRQGASRTWLWIVIGGAAAAAAAGVLLLTLGGGSKDPTPTFGSAPGD